MFKSNVKQLATNKPTAGGTFNLAATSVGGDMRTIAAAYASGATVAYHCTNGTDWEDRVGVYTSGTPGTLSSVLLVDSSTGSAIDWSAGADVTISVGPSAVFAQYVELLKRAQTPGGRLTLHATLPDDLADITGSTLYYLPADNGNDIITLWNGNYWQPISFTGTSLAIGTLTANLPYDVYAYISAGIVTLELLAWTNITTPATVPSLQDGILCKGSGADKTRRWLGTICPNTAITIADTDAFRGVWNLYNRIEKRCYYSAGSSLHTYTTDSSIREYNGTTGVAAVKAVQGASKAMNNQATGIVKSSVAGQTVSLCIGVNSSTSFYGGTAQATGMQTTDGWIYAAGLFPNVPAGLNTFYLCDRNNGTGDLTANYGSMTIVWEG